ncbi:MULTISPECIES: DUF4229 domain-containing protein [Micrococcaceae]|uniref:DUF4229 domain-containing protein n=1 Tax=unclassified Kocuria TaxID=2649579 RepID=UPI001010199F|nr:MULTISPECIES: DUF4229 domain-containing protein [unclassified Kocuria]
MNFLYYTLLRFGMMAVVFVVCLFLKTGLVLAGVFAILIAFAVSYLAFPKLHNAASRDFGRFWQKIRGKRVKKTVGDEDVEVEDQYVDEQLRQEGRDV